MQYIIGTNKYAPTKVVITIVDNGFAINTLDIMPKNIMHQRAMNASVAPGQNSPCLTDLPNLDVYRSLSKLTGFSFDKRNNTIAKVGIVNGNTKPKLMVRAIVSAIHTEITAIKKKTIFQKLSLFILALIKTILGALGLSYIPPYSFGTRDFTTSLGNLVIFRLFRFLKSCITIFHDYRSHIYSIIISKLYGIAKQIISLVVVIFLTLCSNIVGSLASNGTHHFYNKQYLTTLIARAEKKYQIPTGLLAAIAKTESDIRPYVLNIGGKEVIANSVFEANKIIQKNLASKVNIDVGLMQINLYWHRKYFANTWDMLSPEKNVAYAAKLLKSLYKRHGNWHQAIRHYHSANPKFNNKYSRKVITCWLHS